jgi:hypothetical protein
MRKRLGNIFAALSLLLCLATVGLWVRSYWYVDSFGLGAWKDRPHLRLTMYDACTTRGGLLITALSLRFFDESRTPNGVRDYFTRSFWGVELSINARDGEYRHPKSAVEECETEILNGYGIECKINALLGFGVKQSPKFLLWKDTAEKSETFFILPLWALAIITMVAPVRWGIRFQRGRSRKLGCCRKCSYDLRAHQPGQKCPECGTLIPTTSEVKA